MKKVVIILIVLIIIIAIIACLFLNNKNNQIEEIKPSGEIIIADSGEKSGDIIINANSSEKLDHLKEEIQNAFVNDNFAVVSKSEANKIYNFSENTNSFVLKNDNDDEICVVEINDGIDADETLIKVVKRYDNLSEDVKMLHEITIKQRGSLIFLILTNNPDEVEDVIEKEYLDI